MKGTSSMKTSATKCFRLSGIKGYHPSKWNNATSGQALDLESRLRCAVVKAIATDDAFVRVDRLDDGTALYRFDEPRDAPSDASPQRAQPAKEHAAARPRADAQTELCRDAATPDGSSGVEPRASEEKQNSRVPAPGGAASALQAKVEEPAMAKTSRTPERETQKTKPLPEHVEASAVEQRKAHVSGPSHETAEENVRKPKARPVAVSAAPQAKAQQPTPSLLSPQVEPMPPPPPPRRKSTVPPPEEASSIGAASTRSTSISTTQEKQELAHLVTLCTELGVQQCSVLGREELLQAMAEKSTVKQLHAMCKERGIAGYSKLRKAQLVDLIAAPVSKS